MAAPTLSAVSPNGSKTGGRILVELTGTNFKLPSYAAAGPIGPLAPTVRALFGAVPAIRVDVVSATRAFALVPSHDAGIVSVRVDNLDASGNPIAGENATLAASFTFKRPDLSDTGILAHIVRCLMASLKREVLDNVVNTTSVDYDASTGDGLNIVEPAALPVLVLVGPRLNEDRFYSVNRTREEAASGNEFREKRLPFTVQLEFTVLGGADSTGSALALMKEYVTWFNRNRKGFEVPINVLANGMPDFSSATVRYQIEQPFSAAPSMADAMNDSDIRQWAATLLVRGVDVDEDAVIKAGKAVSDVYPALSAPAQPGQTAPPFTPAPDINQPPADDPVPGSIVFEQKG